VTLEELVVEFETEIPRIIAEEAHWVASQIRAKTPPNRVKTRNGVYVQVHGQTATVGIRFAKRYSGDTPTHQRLREQWRQLRPLVRERMITKLNDLLKGS
jgi:hypothetical protein